MGMDFPDVQSALISGLPGLLNGQTVRYLGNDVELDGITVGETVPSPLDAPAVKGFVRVGLVDDPDNRITRFASIEIDVFTQSLGRSKAVAERIRGILREQRRIGGVVIDSCSTRSGPKRVPWDDNSKIRRVLATYVLSTRR